MEKISRSGQPAVAEIGAHELHLDLQFDPNTRSVKHYIDTGAELLREGGDSPRADAAWNADSATRSTDGSPEINKRNRPLPSTRRS